MDHLEFEKPLSKRIADAIGKNWDELMDSGDSELLKKHTPEIFKSKYKEAFGHEPSEKKEKT